MTDADTEDADIWRDVPPKMQALAAEHDLSDRETARAFRSFVLQVSPTSIRSRVARCETMAEVRAWVAVYNHLSWQLPPKYEDLGAAMGKQAERVRDDQAEATADD